MLECLGRSSAITTARSCGCRKGEMRIRAAPGDDRSYPPNGAMLGLGEDDPRFTGRSRRTGRGCDGFGGWRVTRGPLGVPRPLDFAAPLLSCGDQCARRRAFLDDFAQADHRLLPLGGVALQV